MKKMIARVLILTVAGMVIRRFIGGQMEGGFFWSIYAILGFLVGVLGQVEGFIKKVMKA